MTSGTASEHVLLTDDGLQVLVSAHTGLPVELRTGTATQRLTGSVRIDVGGREERTPWGGLVYPDAASDEAADGVVTRHDDACAEVRLRAGAADVVVRSRLRPEHPRLQVDIDVAPAGDRATGTGPELVVRDIAVDLVLDAPDDALIVAPGNRVRPGLALGELDRLVVNGVAGTAGSTGFLTLNDPAAGATSVVWPLCRDAIGSMTAARHQGGCALHLDTRVAGVATPAEPVACRSLWLDLLDADWDEVRPTVADWYPGLGIELPHDQPAWTRSASILEIQLGTSLFGSGFRYAPYPDVADALADLPRIAALGFDTLQVMPRQPFPSYAVVDVRDVAATYGDPDLMAELVRRAHDRGMRVILDVIMHGVVDKEIVRLAADAVRAGPHGEFLTTHHSYRLEDTAELPLPAQVPWSQHILDFEHAWYDGAPARHPLVDAEPEWFYRDSGGEITSVYTKAIDPGHPGFGAYLLAALRHLIERLGIDGFRFDAPTYNGYPNWSPRTRARASASSTAALGLFRMLRQQLRPQYPDLMFYTEPSGVLLRESMDLVYNYDEHAQLEDLMGHRGVALGAEGVSAAGVRHARDLARWFAERDAVLPRRSVTAHHIDSHDTFWWPRPGSKWRREQVGLDATRALASIYALSGGPYMTFVGGELGIEDHLAAIHRLRRRPEFATGTFDIDAVTCAHDEVYAVVRRSKQRAALVLVNASPADLTGVDLDLDGLRPGQPVDLVTGDPVRLTVDGPPQGRTRDAGDSPAVPRSRSCTLCVDLQAYTTVVLELLAVA